MKQLLIVNSQKALNAGAESPKDLSTLEEGAICFFELGADTFLSAAPTANFGIAIGRAKGNPPFIIPEVDIKTLVATLAEPSNAANLKATFTIPAPPENLLTGTYYTILLVKKDTVFNQRYQWSASTFVPVGVTKTAAQIAADLTKQLQGKAKNFNIPFKITVSDAVITLEVTDGTDWKILGADALMGIEPTIVRAWAPGIGDKAYVAELSRKCAGGKGFHYTGSDSHELYQSYPETIEDTTYNVISLKFATGRYGEKPVDERVWQYVHIAVPASSAALGTVKTILGVAKASAGQGGQGQGGQGQS